MRWTTWALIASLTVNAAGLGYVIVRTLRAGDARPPGAYRQGRIDMHEKLTERPPRIVMLGDSLTDQGEWQELLGRDDVGNRGIAGDTIAGATARLPAILAVPPEVIVVMLGINDLLARRSVEDCAADHAELLRQLRAGAPKMRVILQSVLPVRSGVDRDRIESLNQRLAAACATGACEYLDVGRAVSSPDGQLLRELTKDGVHLTGDGYLRWRDVLRPVLDTR